MLQPVAHARRGGGVASLDGPDPGDLDAVAGVRDAQAVARRIANGARRDGMQGPRGTGMRLALGLLARFDVGCAGARGGVEELSGVMRWRSVAVGRALSRCTGG